MSVTLRDVTAENWRGVIALTAPEQEPWVAPNHVSLIEAAYGLGGDLAHLKLVPHAIYADETLVSFALYNTSPTRDRFFIMPLMIDQAHQGRGYGRAVLTQLLALFRTHPQSKEAAISYNQGNEPARQLYQSCGFVELRTENREVMLWQALNPQPAPWTSLWNPALQPA